MTTQQKFRRTFIAMFWGWCVCNLVTFVAFVGWAIFDQGSISNRVAGVMLYVVAAAVWSAVLITASWLLISLPVDLLVGESSWLREPFVAAAIGSVSGAVPMLLIGQLPEIICPAILAAITGLTAALHVVLKHPRIPIPTTTD